MLFKEKDLSPITNPALLPLILFSKPYLESISFGETFQYSLSKISNNLTSNIKSLNLSIESDLVEASHNFYNYINILDQTECNTIAVVPIPNHGLGKTINDRLKRASHNDE